MRLIDADEYKGKVICNHLYSGVTRLIEIDSVPTAFDLESVIEQINNAILPTECYRHRFCENMTIEQCAEHENCEFCIAEKIIEILKSAANATNGKNGG